MQSKSLVALGFTLAIAAGLFYLTSQPSSDSREHAAAPPTVDPSLRSHAPLPTPVAPATVAEQPLDAFHLWLDQHPLPPDPATLDPNTRANLLQLASQRLPAMQALMRQAPKRALARAISLSDYHRLPPEVQPLVEEPFSEIAAVSVLPICQPPSGEKPTAHHIAQVTFPKTGPHEAILFGQRLGMSSKHESPVQGIRLSGLAVLTESTFLPVDPSDATTAAALYPLANPDPARSFSSGAPLGDHPVTALAGGQRFLFQNSAELAAFDTAVSALDAAPGPNSGAALLFAMPAPADGTTGFDLDALIQASAAQASSWTETPKSVFIIRVDFSDKTDADFPVASAATLEQVFDTTVDAQIQAMSYGKTAIESTVSATVTRMPSPTATYTAVTNGSSQNDLLYNNARSAYQAANPTWVESNYNIIGVWFVSIGMQGSGVTYGGLAGGTRLWLQGSSNASLITHELGHNYGLNHSSFWVRSSGTNPVDPSGANDEYGDLFDIMGNGEIPDGHFNTQGKAHLNWLSTSDWQDVTALGSGRYRVHRLDDPGTTGVRGLRVTKGSDEFYWIGHRRAYVNESFDSGAYLQWEKSLNRAWLLDMTPDSASGSADRDDSGLLIGSTYSDPAAAVHITPVAKGGTGANEWLDVQVNLGNSPANTAPLALISAPASVPARTTVFLHASATDADGDELAYSWDLGDGRTADNHPSIPYAWTLGGSYTVNLTVTDMKGGTTTVSHPILVTDAINTWTTRSTPQTVNWTGLAHNGSRVVAVGEHLIGNPFFGSWAWTTDGTTWTAGAFGNNEHLEAVVHDGTQFIAVGQKYDFTPPQDFRGFIATSTDGAVWTQRHFGGPPLASIAVGGGVVVVGGDDGTLLSSTNGTSWTAIAPSPVPVGQRIEGLAHGNGGFVLTAYNYDFVAKVYSGDTVIATSTDGLTWTDRSNGTLIDTWQDLRRTAFLNDRFFSSGWYSRFRSSTDNGQSFVPIRPNDEEFPAMAYGAGIYFAVGVVRPGDIPVAIASQDGLTWSSVPTAAVAGANAAIFFNDTFIIAGDANVIRQSNPITAGAAGYVAWRNQFFPDRGPDSLPTGETDHDGLNTLLEYGMGTSPLSGVEGLTLLPTATTADSDPLLAGRLVLSFSLPEPARSDLVYTVEVSPENLGPWTPLARKTGTGPWQWLPGDTARILTAIVAGRQQIRVGDTVPLTPGTRRFMHLSITPRDPTP